jgi:hypothetical protein
LQSALAVQKGGLDFFTSTGTLSDDAPWSDVEEVNYRLVEPLDRTRSYGRDFVRSVNRNLLATSVQAVEEQRLASNVESLDFFYFDGAQWRDTWDTTLGDTGLPQAVRVRLQLASSEGPSSPATKPFQMAILLESQSLTNQTQTATGGVP